ncbi:MAG: hypothetical protein MI866_06640 [Bacteroidales bacterium]|nr:hypothetical protein [Bacteroidales bacterium]
MNKKTTFYIISICLLLTTFLSCSKEEDAVNINPEAGQSYLNIENDGYQVEMKATLPPEGQSGIWRIYSGENGVFDNVNDPETTFRGEPGEIYRIGWEVSQGKHYESDVITVSFKPLNPQILSNLNDTLTNNISTFINAEPARFEAEGYWQIIEGENGYFIDSTANEAAFIGIENTRYTLRWNLEYGSKISYKELSFTTDTLRADAGDDRRYIRNKVEDQLKYTALEAFLPAGATGQWNLVDGEGGKVYVADHAMSLFEGKAMEDYYLTWKVELDGRTSVDTVNIHFRDKWGLFVDERDGQHYHTVELNGQEWFAENFNYYSPPTDIAWSFYYGQAAQTYMREGHPVETEEEKKYYGRLYNYVAAYQWAPEGWRIPSLKEYRDLIEAMGGENKAMPKLIDGGEKGMDLTLGGALFYSGNLISNKDYFFDQDQLGYLWTNDFNPDTWGCLFMFFDGYNSVVKETSALYSNFSVRYVRDIKTEK